MRAAAALVVFLALTLTLQGANAWKVTDDRGTVRSGSGRARIIAEGEFASAFSFLGMECTNSGPGLGAVISPPYKVTDEHGHFNALHRGEYQGDGCKVLPWSEYVADYDFPPFKYSFNVTNVLDKVGQVDAIVTATGPVRDESKQELEENGIKLIDFDLVGDRSSRTNRDSLSLMERAEEIFLGLGHTPSEGAMSWCRHFNEVAEDFEDVVSRLQMERIYIHAMAFRFDESGESDPRALRSVRPADNRAQHLKLLERLGAPVIHPANEDGGIYGPIFNLTYYEQLRDSGIYQHPYFPPDVLMYESRAQSWSVDLGELLNTRNETTGASTLNMPAVQARQLAPLYLYAPFNYKKLAHELRELMPMLQNARKVSPYKTNCTQNGDLKQQLEPGSVRCQLQYSAPRCNLDVKSVASEGFTFEEEDGDETTTSTIPRRIMAHAQAASTLWDMGFRCGSIVAVYGPQERDDHHGVFGHHAGRVDGRCVRDLGAPEGDDVRDGVFDDSLLQTIDADLVVDVQHVLDEADELPGLYSLHTHDLNDIQRLVGPIAKIRTEGRTASDINQEFKRLAYALGKPQHNNDLDAALSDVRGELQVAAEAAQRLNLRVGGFTMDQMNNTYVSSTNNHPVLRELRESFGMPFVSTSNTTWDGPMTPSELEAYGADIWLYDAAPRSKAFHKVADMDEVVNLDAFASSNVTLWYPQKGFSDQHMLDFFEEFEHVLSVAAEPALQDAAVAMNEQPDADSSGGACWTMALALMYTIASLFFS